MHWIRTWTVPHLRNSIMDFKLILNNSINLDEAIQQKKLTWFKNKSHAWFDKNKETKNEKVNGKFSILFCSIFSLWNKMLVVEREKKKKKSLLVVCSMFLFRYNFLFTWLMDVLILYFIFVRDFLCFKNLVLLCCKWNKLFINNLGSSLGKSFLC